MNQQSPSPESPLSICREVMDITDVNAYLDALMVMTSEDPELLQEMRKELFDAILRLKILKKRLSTSAIEYYNQLEWNTMEIIREHKDTLRTLFESKMGNKPDMNANRDICLRSHLFARSHRLLNALESDDSAAA